MPKVGDLINCTGAFELAECFRKFGAVVQNTNHMGQSQYNSAKATGYKTLEEAQNALNTRVAALNSSLTTKSFYTLSLLDAQTGGYLGFTTQAPPAVALAGAIATS